MNIFSNAAWVWHTAAPAGLNAYCEFTQNFTCDGSHAVCRISAVMSGDIRMTVCENVLHR